MKKIKTQISKLPFVIEFSFVILIAFGYFIMHSVSWIVDRINTGAVVNFSDIDLLQLVILELVILAILSIFLYLRNWKLSDFHFEISLNNSTFGLILFSVNYLIYYFLYMTVSTVFSEFMQDTITISASPITTTASLPAVIAISIINPVFEEALVVGYIVKALDKRAIPWIVITTSVVIRLSYHMYQGPIILFSILPMGLLFAYIYWRWRRLWPLIVAHAVLDFTSFYFYYIVSS